MANKHDYIDYLLMCNSEREAVNQYVEKLHHRVAFRCKQVKRRRATITYQESSAMAR